MSGQSYSNTFTSRTLLKQVGALRTVVSGASGTVASDWVSVTDPYPSPSVSVSVNSISRNPTNGNLNYDFSATASNFWLPDGICAYSSNSCNLNIQVKFADGSTQQIAASANIYGQPYPYTTRFTGNTLIRQVVAARAYLASGAAYSTPTLFYSDWVSVTDPYPSPSVSVSVNSISRNPTNGNLNYDFSATASNFWLPDGICAYSSNSCNLNIQVKFADGSTQQIAASANIYGQPYPYTTRFTGNTLIRQVVAARAYLASGAAYSTPTLFYSDWVSVTDPYPSPSVSVSVNSISRNPTNGNLNYDFSATASNFWLPDGICAYSSNSCNLNIQVKFADGSTQQIAASANIYGQPYPYTTRFTGNTLIRQVVAARAYLASGAAYSTPTLFYSDWVSVTDPYPSPSVSVSVNSISRNPTNGNLNYDFSATASNFWLPDGICAYSSNSCNLNIQVKFADGSTQQIAASANIYGQPYPYTTRFTGNTLIRQVVAARAYLASGAAYSTPTLFYSDWVSVTDPYPSPSVSVSIYGLGRDSSNQNLTWDVGSTASFFWLPDAVCGYGDCSLWIQGKSIDGSISTIDGVSGIYGQLYPFAHEFKGSAPVKNVTAIRAYISGNNGTLSSAWRNVTDLSARETAGGSNPSEKPCQCSHADPINTATGEYYENSTDIGISGVGPALAITRGYSTTAVATDGPFGYGWTGNFTAALTFPSSGIVDVRQENGSVVEYAQQNDGTYAAAPVVHATLTKRSDGTWKFVRQARDTLTFSASGLITAATDLHGNTTAYTSDASGHVTNIIATGGRALTLTWSGSHVTKVTDSAGRSVSYGYDGASNLSSVTAVDGAVTGYGYDSGHYITTITKPGGGVTTNIYDASHRVVTQTDAIGRQTTFAYNGLTTTTTTPDGSQTVETYSGGLLTSQTVAAGTAVAATTSFSYDTAGNVLTKTDALGKTSSYAYDTAGNQLTSTDPLGNTTTRTYDALNDVLTSQDPLGRTTTMTYDSAGDMKSLRSPAGHTSTWTFNSDGTTATATDALSKTTSYSYDSAGRPLCVTDPDLRQTCQSYDSRGLATTKTDGAGKVTTLTYDDTGRVVTITDPNANTTTNAYDADGDLTSTTDPAGHSVTAAYDKAGQRTASTDGLGKATHYTYSARGSLATITDPNGGVVTYGYDALNRLTSTTDADGHVTSFVYDILGRKIATTLPSGAVTSSRYDADGRSVATTDARGKVTNYTYDDAGQHTSTTDPLGRVTAYSYTKDGKLLATTLPDNSVETYTYDANDAQTSFTNADGEVTSYTYDDAGLLSTKTEPGAMTTSYSYDGAGRIRTVTTPDGVVSTRSYDDAGRLTGIDYPGTGNDITYTYFPNGTRHTMTDATGTTTYAYNADAAMISVENGNGQTLGYGYDDAGRLTSITYPGSKTVNYGYDNAGNMTAVTDWASRTTTFTVTPDGLQNTRTDQSGVTETRIYNANNQLTDITSATSSATLSDYGYGYDDAGQLTSSTTTDPLHPTQTTESWGYTALGQLSSTGPSTGFSSSPGGKTLTTPAGDTFTYDSRRELVTASNAEAGTTTTFGYNANGSRTSSTATSSDAPTAKVTYSYDAEGNLASVTTGTNTINYTSDGDGLRQSRTTGSTTQQFLWNTNSAIPLLLDDGKYSYIYAMGTAPIAQIDDTNGTIEYLHGDVLGSIRLITDASGAAIGTTNYDAYGNRTNNTGTAHSAIGYTGNWTDPTTAFVYLRARDYDPATSQFITVDPAIDSTLQPYTYVHNNPLQMVDPLGLSGGNVGTIAGWISVGAGVLGLAADATGFGAPLGAVLEVVSVAAGAVALLDDCFGTFGGDTDITTCGLDAAGLATAGVGEIAGRTAAAASKLSKTAAETGVKEYTAAAKAAKAAALNESKMQLGWAGAGTGTWGLDLTYGRQLICS
ncbi:hypothetical protein GCM10023068_28050 [Leifsonia shinshuensis]